MTYRELSDRSAHLARILLDLGFGPLDRIVVQLPNTAMFAYLYFALQRIGAAPVLALPGHRKREITQFAEISGARALAVPAAARGFDFTAMAAEVMASNPALRLCFVQGADGPPDTAGPAVRAPGGAAGTRAAGIRAGAGRRSASTRPTRRCSCSPAGPPGSRSSSPGPTTTTLYNSKVAAAVCEIGEGDVLLDVLPIEHNLPLACPGMQGFLLSGGTVVLGTSTRPRDVFGLIQRHRVTHIHLVPALLIRWIDDPAIAEYDLSSLRVIQSGGPAAAAGGPAARGTRPAAACFIQENFGMAEGLIMFVRLDDPPECGGRRAAGPISPDDEVRLVDDDGQRGAGRRARRADRPRPVHAARLLRRARAQRRARSPRTASTAPATCCGSTRPATTWSRAGVKDLINRGGEKISAEEVENLILAHPAVLNVACVPYPIRCSASGCAPA